MENHRITKRITKTTAKRTNTKTAQKLKRSHTEQTIKEKIRR